MTNRRPGKNRERATLRNENTPFGEILTYFRIRKRLSVRATAEKAGFHSHSYLAALERGEVAPSPAVVKKLAEALALETGDQKRLEHAATQPDPLVAPGIMVPVHRLLDRQAWEDVKEVWVGVEDRHLEAELQWLKRVIDNLDNRNCPYVYFLKDADAWRELSDRLVSIGRGKELIQKLVTAIQVPEELQPYFFQPPFGLYLVKEPHPDYPAIGVWAFRGSDTSSLDIACEMERYTAYELHRKLKDIVRGARLGDSAVNLGSAGIVFHVLHKPSERSANQG